MFRKEMGKELKMGAKWSILEHSTAPGPTRWLRGEATSSPGWVGCFWRKPPASPPFFYKWTWEAKGKGFSTLGIHISLKISEEKKKEGENQGWGASVMFPWRFRDQFCECSSSFFIRSSSFIILQPISFQFRRFEFILCSHRGPFLLCMFSTSFFYFWYSFSLF